MLVTTFFPSFRSYKLHGRRESYLADTEEEDIKTSSCQGKTERDCEMRLLFISTLTRLKSTARYINDTENPVR